MSLQWNKIEDVLDFLRFFERIGISLIIKNSNNFFVLKFFISNNDPFQDVLL